MPRLRSATVVVLLLVFAQPLLLTSLPAAQPERVIHVDAESPTASDRNPGTPSLPVRSVGRGIRMAAAANANGEAVRVVIHAGRYRETVVVPEGGTGAAMSIEAAADGQVVITGSDAWTGWARLGATPVFAHEWPYQWGLAPIPRQWPSLQEIVRRRELVVVGGQPLRQLVSQASLEAGTFYVDEPNRRVYLWAAGGADPNTVPTEVAVRPTLFAASGRSNLTVSGLVFEHAATAVDASAVVFQRMNNLVVRDNVFQWNNWGGLAVAESTNVTALRNIANHNGGRGMEAYEVKSIRYADNETSYNDWRGAAGGFTGWAAAGIKLLLVHDAVISRHRSVSNQAHGFWLDTDNANVTITDGVWCGNRRNGAFIESSQGPITVANTVICHNGQDGIMAIESSNLTLRSSALYGNKGAQFEVTGDPEDTVKNWETGEPMAVRAQNLTLCGNAIVGESRDQDLLAMPSWGFLLSSLSSTRNDWWNPQNEAVFHLKRSARLDLGGWRQASGQDADSVYADPRFADAAAWNFAPLAGTSWQRCDGAASRTPRPPATRVGPR